MYIRLLTDLQNASCHKNNIIVVSMIFFSVPVYMSHDSSHAMSHNSSHAMSHDSSHAMSHDSSHAEIFDELGVTPAHFAAQGGHLDCLLVS